VATVPFYELDGQLAIDLPGARGVFTTASWGDLRETFPQVAQRLGVAAVRAHQVHGNRALLLSEDLNEPQQSSSARTLTEEADALLSTEPGVAATVITADCIPVLISSGSAVAAVHAGWRGLHDEVLMAAVARLYQLNPDAELVAVIGPGAGPCCYEVSEELQRKFQARGLGHRVGTSRRLDLHAIAHRQLSQLGVAEIHYSGVCTICSRKPRMFSYRRQGDAAGRQGALIWLT
jgi:YfiH family protein